MSIGLKRGEVAVENHQIEWEISAKNIIDLLKNTLKDDIVDAQHIGSTLRCNRVLFVERSGELRMLARLRTKGPEPKRERVLIGR